MPVILCVTIAALALIVGVVTRYLTITNLKNNAESKIGNAEAKAREITDDAVKTAETTKKGSSFGSEGRVHPDEE